MSKFSGLVFPSLFKLLFTPMEVKEPQTEPTLFVFKGVEAVSANTFYVTNRYGARFLTTQARKFKKAVADCITGHEMRRKVPGNVSVYLLFGLKDRRARDVDNMIKHFVDCIKGVLMDDDHHIQDLEAIKFYSPNNPCVFAIITPQVEFSALNVVEHMKENYPSLAPTFEEVLKPSIHTPPLNKRRKQKEKPPKKRKIEELFDEHDDELQF